MSLQELQEQVCQLSVSDRVSWFWLYVGMGAIASGTSKDGMIPGSYHLPHVGLAKWLW